VRGSWAARGKGPLATLDQKDAARRDEDRDGLAVEAEADAVRLATLELDGVAGAHEPSLVARLHALEAQEFLRLLTEVGFEDPSIEPTRIYRSEDACAFLTETGLNLAASLDEIDGKFMAAFVRATKPSRRA
jgi:hypothetical protein